jgi:antibiotic biosynthesis monooxygenase (ABM) superfamily enzyme
MVMYVVKWYVIPSTKDTYAEWTKSIIPRLLKVPGVKEFRAYRTAVGDSQAVVTFEFENMVDFGSWNEQCSDMLQEGYDLCANMTSEIWGPSQLVPDPIRPGG